MNLRFARTWFGRRPILQVKREIPVLLTAYSDETKTVSYWEDASEYDLQFLRDEMIRAQLVVIL